MGFFKVNWLIKLTLVLLFASPVHSEDLLYVLNTLSENISIINLSSNVVNADASTVGTPETADYPNDLIIRNNLAYVINSGINEIQVLDLSDMTTLKRINTGIGSNPYSLEFINEKNMAVSLLFANEVVFFNVEEETETGRVQVDTGPEGLKLYNGKLYVANTNFISYGVYGTGTVSVIDPASKTVAYTIPVGVNPQRIESDGMGNLYVLCTGDYESTFSSLYKIDGQTDTVIDSVLLSGEFSISNFTITKNHEAILSGYGFVLVYDLLTDNYIKDHPNALKGGPGICVDKNHSIYLTDFSQDSVYVYNPDYTLLKAYLVGDGPIALAVHPDLQTGVNDRQQTFVNNRQILTSSYPNPFNSSTIIEYNLTEQTHVQLDIFDIRGSKIVQLVNQVKQSGFHNKLWETGNLSGGLYFYRLQIGNGNVVTKKMLLVR